MSPSADFFTRDVRTGTIIKLRMLDWYLQPWCGKLSAYARRAGLSTIWFVDPFAGEGRLAKGERGSPLIAASKSLARIQEGADVKLGIYAVERRGSAFRKLKQSLDAFRESGVPVKVKHGDWDQFVDDILQTCGHAPVLLFVDPFGLKGIRLRRLDRLISRPATDVIFRIHDASIHRNAAANPSLVTEALDTDRWNHGWDLVEDPDERIVIALSAFADRLQRWMGRGAEVVHYRVRTSWSGKPKFTLVLASKNRDAIDLWHENAGTQEIELARAHESKHHMFTDWLVAERQQRVVGWVRSHFEENEAGEGEGVMWWVRQRYGIVKGTEINSALRTCCETGHIARPEGSSRGWRKVRFSRRSH